MELGNTFSEYVEWMSESHCQSIDYYNEIDGQLMPAQEEKIYRLATTLLRHSLDREGDAAISLHIRLGEEGMIHIDYREEGGFDSRILEDRSLGLGSQQIHSSLSALGGFALVRTRPGQGCSIDLKLTQTNSPAA